MTTDGTSEKFNSILNVASIGKGPQWLCPFKKMEEIGGIYESIRLWFISPQWKSSINHCVEMIHNEEYGHC